LNATPLVSPEPLPSVDALIGGLAQHGISVQANGVPPDVARSLINYISRVGADAFHEAMVGRGEEQQQNRFVRRDRIHWIDERNPELACWQDWTESLRLEVNRRLFLGLFSFESHLAHYRSGDFYRTHVDAFRGEANRIVSLVCYLNENWSEDDGGELVLYTDLGPVVVAPAYGTVAMFLSEEIPHEVRPARRDRFSITGWFRLNTSAPDRVDPPR
jgi:SM-20-related protein